MSLTVVEKHQLILQSFHESYTVELIAEAREGLAKSILDLRKGTRWYQTSVAIQIQEIWETIRTDERLLDYVMEGTSALMLHGMENDAEERKLIEKIAFAWAWSHRSCLTDKQLSERAPTVEFARQQLSNNSWLIFVYLLQYIRQM